ncbi:MAG: RHS repeat-associated core domain-containing protein [Terracidiphilus sp.]
MSGWNHNGFRDYVPELGRYIEPDPLGRLGSGNNLYVYAGDNPIDFVDLLGLCSNNIGVYKNPCAYAGRAMTPSAYAAQGQAANGNLINFALDVKYGFPRGGYLDAQPYAIGTSLQRAAYGNYVFGVYMENAGLSLSQTLSAANAYADISRAQYGSSNGPMDRNYPSIPVANVVNITAGFLQGSFPCQP